MPVSLEDVDQAIAAIVESRESHLGWIGHDSDTCETCLSEPISSIAGDDMHHRACVEKYDQVLRVLRELRAFTHESLGPPVVTLESQAR